MQLLLELIVIGIVLALTAVLAAYETAISAVTHARLVALERANVRGAAAAVAMKSRIERSLAVVQLGMTFLSAIAGACGGASVEESFAPILEQRFGLSAGASHTLALVAVVIPLAALTVVFAELAPKVLAIRHRERVACLLSPAMRYLAEVLAPVATLLEGAVRRVLALASRLSGRRGAPNPETTSLHELTAAAALARTAKLIGAREERIVSSAALLSSRTLGEIELPAADISMLSIDASLESALVQAHLDMHTRFPVARDPKDPQTIEGYISFKDLVAQLKMAEQSTGLRAIVRPIRRISRSTTIAKSLDILVKERSHIALVVGDDERVSGLVTLEDIIEELVGDIEDEYDRLPSFLTAAGDGWIVGGGLPLATLMKQLGLPVPDVRAKTASFATDSTVGAPAAISASASASGTAGGSSSATATATASRVGTATASAIAAASMTPASVADWVQQRLGHAPTGGESITADGILLLVRKLRRKRLAEAFVRRR
jgi:magnesium and cobalt exporter, CNNM family